MHPAQLLTVKQQVLKSDLSLVNTLANRMLKTDEPEKLQQLLERMNG
jgi:phosphotransferase system enzyme I (PtsI)